MDRDALGPFLLFANSGARDVPEAYLNIRENILTPEKFAMLLDQHTDVLQDKTKVLEQDQRDQLIREHANQLVAEQAKLEREAAKKAQERLEADRAELDRREKESIAREKQLEERKREQHLETQRKQLEDEKPCVAESCDCCVDLGSLVDSWMILGVRRREIS